MASSRLTLAIDAGSVRLPDSGDIAVFRPTAMNDLSSLPKGRVRIIQGFYPDHALFVAQGFNVSVVADQNYAAAIVFLPRSKAQSHALIARALSLTNGGPVIVDGQKTDGIDSILKGCRALGGDVSGVYSKAHGKMFTVSGGEFSGWLTPGPSKTKDGFVTQPGVFSADGIDRGSAALVAALPGDLRGKIADLGAGWGYLAHHILKSQKVAECHLIEAEHSALACARLNISDTRARYHWADARNFDAVGEFDHIVVNPPFHTGRAPDPDIGRAFIAASGRLLSRRGVVWLVANRHLPYEQVLSSTFSQVEQVAGDASFKVFRATSLRPKHS